MTLAERLLKMPGWFHLLMPCVHWSRLGFYFGINLNVLLVSYGEAGFTANSIGRRKKS